MSRLDKKFVFLFVFIVSGILAAQPGAFGDRVDLGFVEHDDITEASGVAASRKNSGVLWTHNDSGGENRLFALDTQGQHLGIYYLVGCENRDWEDMAVGLGPVEDQHYLYIGDIGDNQAVYDTYRIYRVMEPDVVVGQNPVIENLNSAEDIAFRYPDGSRDAEALMVDPLTKDIYVISKEWNATVVYRAAYPQSTQETLTLERVTTFSQIGIVAGDVSPDGSEILMKNYFVMYYWRRQIDKTLGDAFAEPAATVPYIPEPQGEAVCWKSDGMGYYTISEEFSGTPCRLYFYPRLEESRISDGWTTPTMFALYPNYPNPFNASTVIMYHLSEPLHVGLNVYGPSGDFIKTLMDSVQPQGTHRMTWDGTDEDGNRVSSGVYVIRLDTESFQDSRSVVLVK